MAFPDLFIRTGTILEAENTGVPDPGANVIGLPFRAAGLDVERIVEDNLVVDVKPVSPGAGFNAVVLGSPLLNADKTEMTLVFNTNGVATVNIVAKIKHSATL